MINSLSVTGLKSIDSLKINFNKINILVGTNSSGKSSLIQAILLASQNLDEINCPLNGNLISLGDFREVRNFITNAQEIKIGIKLRDCYHNISIVESDENKEDSCKLFKKSEDQVNANKIKEQLSIDEGLYYLSSSRIGHKDIYEKSYSKTYKFGLLGEYCLYYFEKHKDLIIDKKLIHMNASNTLESQVNFWLKYIVGSELSTEDIKETDKIKANFRSGDRNIRTKNVGSGISYLVSIIIMCLSIKEGDTIIIENPEIHLHPRAQSNLTNFFVFIANTNRQIIIETHSDHIFNGVRVAVALNALKKEDYAINFFSLDERKCTQVDNIEVSKRGRIVNSPEGLFDQFETDIDKMLGLIDDVYIK